MVFSDGEMRTARLLVTAQFVLLGLIALLPGGWGWPVPVWLRWLGVAGAVAGRRDHAARRHRARPWA